MPIIFDLDGTLLDSIDDLGNSLNTILKAHGYPTHDRETYHTYVGNGMRVLTERAVPKDCEDFEEILSEFLEEYSHHVCDASIPYPDVYNTLKELNEKGVPIAVCTNKKQEYTNEIMNHYFKGINFVDVIGDQFDGNHKPNPMYPLMIADKMGVDPSEIFFVGDSDVDMKTAHNANMIPIGVSWGFRSVEELKTHGASRIINSITEILDF